MAKDAFEFINKCHRCEEKLNCPFDLKENVVDQIKPKLSIKRKSV